MKKLMLLTCVFISFNLFAQPFSMIKEINTTATTGSFGSSLIQRVGSTVYFVANDGVSGNELWKSDGTSAGTVIIKDINPGSGSTSFANFTAGDGLLFFTANDGVNGFELWRTDGTDAGTFMLRDGFSGCTFCLNRYFFHNGILYFAGDDGTTGAELWKTDGTIAGTVLVKDIFPGSTTSHPAPTSNVNYTFVAMGNDIYFSAVDAAGGRELFKSDGTEAGTVMIKDIYPGATSSISTVNHKAAVFNGKVYFAANDGPTGVELWATDGTEAGTYLVKDIVVGSGRSQPNNLIAFNGALYFTASSADNSLPDLWKTDGTEAGTVLVRNLVADGITLTIGNSSAIDQFTIANGKLFFRGNGPNGFELYATDGTTAGTGIVKDIYPGVNGINFNSLFAYDNHVYFQGTDVELPSRGGALYKSDGTAAGTVQLTDGGSGGALGLATSTMTSAAGRLFFWGNNNDNGVEPWITDGTNANTALLKDINTIKVGTPNSGASALATLVYNGYYYYAAVDDQHGNELWRSDGTPYGTEMVKDIWPGKAPSNPAQFFVYNGAIYFTASNGLSGTELWKTDGTELGTVLVADINPGPVNSGPNRFFISNNYLYFTAYHSLYGIELWRSDGTAAGTNMVLDLVTGPAHGTPGITDVVSLNNNAYAIMNIAAGNVLGIPSGNRLIKIDGVSNTIADFAPVVTTGIDLGTVGNTLFITGRNAANQTLLWKSENGSAVTQVKILSTTVTNAYQLTNCGGKLYFSASNGAAAGQEPWISDGTDAGTFMLKDVNPGANNSTPYQFIFSGGKVYFTASAAGNVNGEYELWATDGTTAGTYLVKDILPGTTGSRPNATISAFGNKVLFTASDGSSGYELWQSDGTAAGTFLLQEFNTNGDGMPLTGLTANFATDYIYSKLGDKIIFFARSADKGLQLYSGSIASPYKYVNDNSTANDVYTSAVGDNANNGSQSAPYATLSHAVSQAQAGDTIYVDAGVFVEQVTIDKGISLIGAGSGATIVWKPAVINPPPGPFTEPGTIQSVQNIGDVHIRDMSVTGDDNGVVPIVLQTGGSVKNCRLIGGSQGIFFRVDPAIKTAVIENNYIRVASIGINCQGSGLTASLINNTIELTNPGFAAGVFAGLDFGPLVRFTAFGNSIRDYNYVGFLVNSYNTNITQNSILGTGGPAIQQQSGNTTLATCNWFGTSNAGTVASKIIGTVIYTPFLTDGTDNSSNVGFQPIGGACATGTSYYVNDGSNTGDIFTTASGNDANAGTAAAPFGTLQHAVNTAAANDIIYVDAGTYTEQVTITKGINIIGAGQNVTSILKPAVTAAPPGPFPEQGVIQTAQNIGDVNIRDVSVTGDFTVGVTPLIIQSGGSVRNCKLQGGNQGLFVRIDAATNPGAKTFYIEGNTIQAEFIAVNTAGTSLHAILSNNTIAAFNAGFSSGLWAGMDFGPLGRLTATNNLFSTYSSSGIQISASNASITQNAFTGTGAQAINRTGGANITANCNWYGTANASAIVPKITAGVNYYPWYVDGTDANPVAGFQHYSESCGGGLNILYVNDNNTTGDLFTTTIGNDANAGTPTSPLATFIAALTRATVGTVIYMDAGTYTAQDATIDKQVQVIGTNFNASPNSAADPLLLNSNRNAETIIENTNWIIGANSLYFDGLTFNPLGKQAITLNSTTWSDTRLLRNRFRISSGLTQLNFTGSGTTTMALSAIANWNLNIRENRFEKEDVNFGTAINVSRYGGVNISNNSFVITGTALRTKTAIRAGFDGVVNYLSINNNNFDRVSTAINSSRLAIANISFNKIINTNTAFFGFNQLPESSEVAFRNNTLDGSGGIFPFINYTRQEGTAVGASSSFIAEENTITGTAVAGTTTLLGSMNLIFFNSVLNPSLIVRNNKMTYAGDLSTIPAHLIRPIMIRGNMANAVIEKNEINLTGINQQPRTPGENLPVSPAITLYTDNTTASFLQSGSVINILNNKINGFKHSFAAYDGTSTGNDAYVGYGNIPAGATVNVTNNSFTGDSISINNGSVGQPVLATCNWYGSADAAVVVPKISGIATYSPWLSNGTDNDVATGFQPIPNVCNGRQNKFYVNDALQTGDVFTTAIGDDANSGIPSAPLATMGTAISRATAGDIIYVDAGTYIENVIINKSVTLLGVKNGQSPGSSLDRGGESIIVPAVQTLGITGTIIQPAADNITIDGFLLDGDNPSLTTGSIVNGVDVNIGCGIYNNNVVAAYLTVKNTIVKNVQTYGIGLFRAFPNTDGPAVPGNLFTNNRVDNVGSRGIVLGYNAYGNITNNYISRCLSTGTWFSQHRVANVDDAPSFISGNIIEDCNLGMQSSSLEAPASLVYYLNNEITNSTTSNFAGISLLINNAAGAVVSNNKISGYARGMYINATNASAPILVNNNSITSFTNFAIEVASTNSVNASCNWYGTVDAAIIATKVSANVNYIPWLTNGTDADPSSTGFQPLPGVCNGTPVVATLISQTNVSCFGGNNGSADVGISGGVLPYTTTWSREGDAGFSQNGEDLLNALAGNYTLLITDAVGATATVQVSLQEPLQLVGLVSGTNVTCFGAADGTATIEVNGGVLPYTYLWSNGAETAGISSLSPGIYSITVTDANGCTVGGSYTVIQPAAVNPAISVTNISCAGAANGQIALTGRAGVAPYMFSLDGIAYQESNVFASLTAGNYTGYVMDANGCVGTVSATISEPLPLEVVLTSVTGTCTGTSNGAIDVTVSGGTTRYGFAWTGPNNFTSTREDLTKVVAGTYTLVVTDANGCIANLMVVVGETPALVITGNVIPVSCFGTLTGAIDVSVTGGSGSGYTYVWSGPNGYKASTEDVSGLRAGSYTLTVTDAGGCSGSKVYTVTQPAIALSVTATKDDIIACDALGSITATAAGGTAPYQYSLNGGALQSGNIFPNLPVGSYSIQATDTKGCTTAPLSVSIADNGADAYESNNTATAPININVGSTIRARLAAAKGTDVDWYRFTTTATGSYSVSWNHPLVSQTFDLYVLNKNKAELVPLTSMVGNTKSYTNLSPNTYLVQVSGTQSLICYDLAVNSLSVPPLITSAPAFGNQARTIIPEEQHLSATAFPNPHRGSFTLRIESPEEGVGTVDMYTVNGQWLSERKVNLGKGKANQVQYSNMKHAVLFYRVRIGKHVVTGKVIGGN